MSDLAIKPELAQISNYVGAAVAVVGNALPYLTPDLLAGLGVPSAAVHTVASVAALLLIAFREKQPAPGVALAVPPSAPGDTSAKP